LAGLAVQIKATDLVEDLRAGLHDDAIMSKHDISAQQLQNLLQKLVEGGYIEQVELNTRAVFWALKKARGEAESVIEVQPDAEKLAPDEDAPPEIKKQSQPKRIRHRMVILAGLLGVVLAWLLTSNSTSFLVLWLTLGIGFYVFFLIKSGLPVPEWVPTEFLKATRRDIARFDWKEIKGYLKFDWRGLKKDYRFLCLLGVGISPLAIGMIAPEMRTLGYALFFAVIWGGIFKVIVAAHTGKWLWPIGSLLFTCFIGAPMLMVISHSLGHSVHKGLVYFVLKVGCLEELWKIVPTVFYVLRNSNFQLQISPLTVVVIAVFSGLGFAAAENVGYSQLSFWRYVPEAAADNAILRSVSLVFLHGVLSGIVGCFLAISVARKRPWHIYLIVGLVFAGVLHGIYDFFCLTSYPVAVGTVILSFLLFYTLVQKIKGFENSTETQQTESNAYRPHDT
jgi:RsiW-degrading membrane proteinase PrsW (M82 family)